MPLDGGVRNEASGSGVVGLDLGGGNTRGDSRRLCGGDAAGKRAPLDRTAAAMAWNRIIYVSFGSLRNYWLQYFLYISHVECHWQKSARIRRRDRLNVRP